MVEADHWEDDPPDDVLREVAADEHRAWEQTLPCDEHGEPVFPNPHGAQGLPDGWVVRSQTVTPARENPDTDWLLVRRDAGGWLLVNHDEPLSRTSLRGGAITIGGIYEKVHRPSDPQPRGVYSILAGWLRTLIVDAYDPADEIEAAARVMVALGGPVTVTPRTLA